MDESQSGRSNSDIVRNRFLESLRHSQWQPPQEWARYQGRLLERLVRHAHAETDRYCDILDVLFKPDGGIDWNRWADVPILTREMAQADPGALTARQVPALAGRTAQNETSGSTSRAFRFLTDELAQMATYCLGLRFYEWHNINGAGRLGLIKAYGGTQNLYPEGGHTKGWDHASPDGEHVMLNINSSVDEQIDWLERVRPDYLGTYPSNMIEVGRAMGRSRARKLALKAYVSFGEAFDDQRQQEIEDIFEIPMVDRYGSTETGQVSARCPSSRLQHVAMENVYFELLDQDNRPVGPGESGRIVVTPFYNYSMPFIRYETGDQAMLASEPCPCGRSLISIERILGRVRCMFRFADGSAKWPNTMSKEIREFVPHRQLQVVQTALDRIELRVVPVAADQDIDLPGLTGYFRLRLHETLNVDVRYMDAIPRAPSGKFFDYYSDIAGA